jgi:hypothetical protein
MNQKSETAEAYSFAVTQKYERQFESIHDSHRTYARVGLPKAP